MIKEEKEKIKGERQGKRVSGGETVKELRGRRGRDKNKERDGEGAGRCGPETRIEWGRTEEGQRQR